MSSDLCDQVYYEDLHSRSWTKTGQILRYHHNKPVNIMLMLMTDDALLPAV